MRKFAEWIYFAIVKLSLILTVAIPGYVLVYYARELDGPMFRVFILSYLRAGMLFGALFAIRYCLMKIFGILSPYTIDGDKLLRDYDLHPRSYQQGDFETLEFRPVSHSGSTITLSVDKNYTVPIIRTSNSKLRDALPSLNWNVSETSVADPKMSCYIMKLGDKRLFLSEYQTIDLFCYLLADRKQVKDADEIDDEIEKYLSGLGLVSSPQ